MSQHRRIPIAVAAVIAVFIVVAPSESTQARWSDSVTLDQPLLTTVSAAAPASPPHISIGGTEGPSAPGSLHTVPGFSVTPDQDVELHGLTVRRANFISGTGMPNLRNHVDIDVWLTPARGDIACRAFADSFSGGTAPAGAVRLGDTVEHSSLNGGKPVSLLTTNPIIEADTTRSICPIVTITKGSASDYAGASFELIFRYTFTSAVSGEPVSAETTTLFAIDAAGTASGPASRADRAEAGSAADPAAAERAEKPSRSTARPEIAGSEGADDPSHDHHHAESPAHTVDETPQAVGAEPGDDEVAP